MFHTKSLLKITLTAAIAVTGLIPGLCANPVQAANPVKSACAVITLENPHSDACNAEIEQYPAPDLVRPVAVDEKLHGASIPRSVLLPEEGTRYPIGWVLKAWFYRDVPGVTPADYNSKARIIPKRTLLYIYATVKIGAMEWFMVAPDRWLSSEEVSILKMPTKPEGVTGQWITLDLSEQTLIAFEDDTPVFATLISASYDGYGFTREGLFNIYARAKSTTFRGPPWSNPPKYVYNHVPDVMFFDEDIALHGAYWHDFFGFPRSHGCVNVPVGDETWLYKWVEKSAAKWGSAVTDYRIAKPENAPFVYVYRSANVKPVTAK